MLKFIHIFAYTTGIGLIGAAGGVVGVSWLIRNNPELKYLVLKDMQYLGTNQPIFKTFDHWHNLDYSYKYGSRKDN